MLMENDLCNMSPVYVLGCGHSGNTLMAALIARHPDVWAQFSGPQVKETSYFKNQKELAKSLAECEKKGKRLMMEKKPRNVHSIDQIRSEFPFARVLMMVRDPHQVVPSLMKRRGSYEGALRRYITDNKPLLGRMNHSLNMVVRYEDLVAHPLNIIQSAFRFASLRAERSICDSVLQSRTNGKTAPSSSGRKHGKLRNWEVEQPVSSSFADSAKRFGIHLSPDYLHHLECATFPYIIAFGYSFRTEVKNCSTS
jgi:hypothetical protein